MCNIAEEQNLYRGTKAWSAPWCSWIIRCKRGNRILENSIQKFYSSQLRSDPQKPEVISSFYLVLKPKEPFKGFRRHEHTCI